jgi:hypothetical protein
MGLITGTKRKFRNALSAITDLLNGLYTFTKIKIGGTGGTPTYTKIVNQAGVELGALQYSGTAFNIGLTDGAGTLTEYFNILKSGTRMHIILNSNYAYSLYKDRMTFRDTAGSEKLGIDVNNKKISPIVDNDISIGENGATFKNGYYGSAVGVRKSGIGEWGDVLSEIPDSIKMNCRMAFKPETIKEYGLGVYDYSTTFNAWLATAGAVVTAGWTTYLKSYGIRSIIFRGSISDATTDSFHYGENDGGNNLWRITKGTTNNKIKFETDNNTGTPQVTDDININPTSVIRYKVTIDNGTTKLYTDSGSGYGLKATHITNPCPINVILNDYFYAKTGGAYLLTMNELYKILGVVL